MANEVEPRVVFATDQVLVLGNKLLADPGSDIGLQTTSPGVEVPDDRPGR